MSSPSCSSASSRTSYSDASMPSPPSTISLPNPREVHRAKSKAEAEFTRIQHACPVLRSTGCTEQFCQAGRMVKTNDPRVGQDRDAGIVREEALDFLRQLRRDGVLDTDEALAVRVCEVMSELKGTSRAVDVLGRLPNEVTSDAAPDGLGDVMLAGGLWHQTREELEHGLRLAWKNSSKCIMRSESHTLQLCDLRHITSSREMGQALIVNMKKAFNHGDIKPTACVFPPRHISQRGPMVWNGQLLSFAGYKNDDGTILGDPANVSLTRAILALGWNPPSFRTRWDLLPLVTMAEGDEPYITEVSEADFPVVHVDHPRDQLAFKKLGLRWVAAPALCQLGFDIGGVQYTATPFMGWFMDAEIGVRDLADRQRYNVLPQVVTALGWAKDEATLERLPEHERLVLLSKAQAELNFAVYHSYKEAGVMMSDTLTASSMYCNYDDEHFREKGYRLNSNPYWLAPPQGSIVPIWHRGGAPNYQPTPLICKHAQNPIKAWSRQLQERHNIVTSKRDSSYDAVGDPVCTAQDDAEVDVKAQVHIFYCSAATTARKLAGELHRVLRDCASSQFGINAVKSLNELVPSGIADRDTVLIIASTSGHGEVPANGATLVKRLRGDQEPCHFGFMIFGNGSSLYSATYNEAARQIHEALVQNAAEPLGSGLFAGDTAVHDPPWEDFERWLREVLGELGLSNDSDSLQASDPTFELSKTGIFNVASSFRPARLASCQDNKKAGILRVTLEVQDLQYEPLSHIMVVVPNDKRTTKKALKSLRLSGGEKLRNCNNMTTQTFLNDFVDFDQSFTDMAWAGKLGLSGTKASLMGTLPLKKALKIVTRVIPSSIHLEDLFAAMPLKTPRTYSTACSQALLQARGNGPHLELLVQARHQGLAASFFKTTSPGTALRIRHVQSKWELLLHQIEKPVICFATGSGLAPIRSLLQHRLYLVESGEDGIGPLTLILGFRSEDAETIQNAIHTMNDSVAAGIVDICLLTPSNPDKIRAQDRVFESEIRPKIEEKLKVHHANVLVCASPEAAAGFEVNLRAIVGCDVAAALGERYVQEIFAHRNSGPSAKMQRVAAA